MFASSYWGTYSCLKVIVLSSLQTKYVCDMKTIIFWYCIHMPNTGHSVVLWRLKNQVSPPSLLNVKLNSTSSRQCGKTWFLIPCSATTTMECHILGILGTDLYNCHNSPLIKIWVVVDVIIVHFCDFLGWNYVLNNLITLLTGNSPKLWHTCIL